MKVAIINFSGNVGKTTIARHLLMPRMPDAQYVPVESINADEGQAEALRGKQFAQLQEFLLLSDAAVVDIGASNVEDLVALMKRYKDSHEDFDVYIVPTVPGAKQQHDTVKTLMALVEMGVDPKRLRVVFNQLEPGTHAEAVCTPVLAYAQAAGLAHVSSACTIGENELFGRLKGTTDNIQALADDKTDHKALIAAAQDIDAKRGHADRLATVRLARSVVPELDACFAALLLS